MKVASSSTAHESAFPLIAALSAGRTQQRLDPISQLVFGLMSKDASSAVARSTFNFVRQRSRSWAQVCDMPIAKLADMLTALSNPRDSARDILAALVCVKKRFGAIDLQPLKRLTHSRAREILLGLPGVDEWIADSILCFSSLGNAAPALDTNGVRVAQRVGLAARGAPASAIPRLLLEAAPKHWTSRDFSEFSTGIALLALTQCRDVPKCDSCSIARACAFFGRSERDGGAAVVQFPKRGNGQVTSALRSGDRSAG